MIYTDTDQLDIEDLGGERWHVAGSCPCGCGYGAGVVVDAFSETTAFIAATEQRGHRFWWCAPALVAAAGPCEHDEGRYVAASRPNRAQRRAARFRRR